MQKELSDQTESTRYSIDQADVKFKSVTPIFQYRIYRIDRKT